LLKNELICFEQSCKIELLDSMHDKQLLTMEADVLRLDESGLSNEASKNVFETLKAYRGIKNYDYNFTRNHMLINYASLNINSSMSELKHGVIDQSTADKKIQFFQQQIANYKEKNNIMAKNNFETITEKEEYLDICLEALDDSMSQAENSYLFLFRRQKVGPVNDQLI